MNFLLTVYVGAILVFGSFATAFWCSALILNLHLHTVWNYGFFTNRYVLLNTICWGIPTAITCIAIGLHAIKFEVASLCLVSMEYIFKLFFYPLAAIIIPSFLVHIATFFYIAHIAIREGLQSDMTQSLSAGNHPDRQPAVNHRHIMAAVQIQWRALMLAVAAIVTVLFYWVKQSKNAPFLAFNTYIFIAGLPDTNESHYSNTRQCFIYCYLDSLYAHTRNGPGHMLWFNQIVFTFFPTHAICWHLGRSHWLLALYSFCKALLVARMEWFDLWYSLDVNWKQV